MISNLNNNFSAGEKKRLAIIRALLKNTQCIILDEPDAGLDYHNVKIIKKFFLNLSNKKTIIMTTHSDVFDDIADEIIYL